MSKKTRYEVCGLCKHKNNIDEMDVNGDYDESWRPNHRLYYCLECGSQFELKVK